MICNCELFGYLVRALCHFRYPRSCLRSNKAEPATVSPPSISTSSDGVEETVLSSVPRLFLLLSRYPPSLTSSEVPLLPSPPVINHVSVSLLLSFLFYSFRKYSLKTPYSSVRYRCPKHPMGNNWHQYITEVLPRNISTSLSLS